MKIIILLTVFFFMICTIYSQETIEDNISAEQAELQKIRSAEKAVMDKIEDLKLKKVLQDIQESGLPHLEDGEMVVYHCAFAFCYSEEHEQSKWVVHIVTPDIIHGNVTRTNDFREDSLVKSGTSTKSDYWYSGYDRGHLAPSADFRWSQKALSESYYYSNMAPQRPELNRERWAELEGKIRAYVTNANEQVIVVTGGILKPDLPVMETKDRVNDVSIPEHFYKVVLDYSGTDKRAIAFIMPNKECNYPVFHYAVSVDSVEKLTGIDFFHSLPDEIEEKLESSVDVNAWKTGGEKGDVLPLIQKELPRKTYNTIQAKEFIDEDVTICGTVVSTKFHERTGGTFINLDKKFPNQVFSITIWKDQRINFSYVPEVELMNKKICVKGKLGQYKGTPSMTIKHEKQILFLDDDRDY